MSLRPARRTRVAVVVAIAMALALLLVPGLATAASTRGASLPAVPMPALASSPVTGTLDAASDSEWADVYAVQLTEGQKLVVDLTGAPGTDFGVYLYQHASDFSLFPVLIGDVPDTSSEHLEYTVPKGFGGTYYVSAEALRPGDVGSYTLTWSTGAAVATAPVRTAISLYRYQTIGGTEVQTAWTAPSLNVAYGARAGFSVHLDALPSTQGLGLPMPTRTLAIYSRTAAAPAWKYYGSAVTNAAGMLPTSLLPLARTTHFQFRYAATRESGYFTNSTSVFATVVRTAYLTAPSVPGSVYRTSTFTSSGYVGPRHAAGTFPVKVMAYRYVNGAYVYYASFAAKASNSTSTKSRYAVSVRLPYRGAWKLRAYHAADSVHVATYSAFRYVTVK